MATDYNLENYDPNDQQPGQAPSSGTSQTLQPPRRPVQQPYIPQGGTDTGALARTYMSPEMAAKFQDKIDAETAAIKEGTRRSQLTSADVGRGGGRSRTVNASAGGTPTSGGAPYGLDISGNPKAAPDSILTPRIPGVTANGDQATSTPGAPTSPASTTNVPPTGIPSAAPTGSGNPSLMAGNMGLPTPAPSLSIKSPVQMSLNPPNIPGSPTSGIIAGRNPLSAPTPVAPAFSLNPSAPPTPQQRTAIAPNTPSTVAPQNPQNSTGPMPRKLIASAAPLSANRLCTPRH